MGGDARVVAWVAWQQAVGVYARFPRGRPTLDERGLWSPFTGHSCSPGSCACADLGPAPRRLRRH